MAAGHFSHGQEVWLRSSYPMYHAPLQPISIDQDMSDNASSLRQPARPADSSALQRELADLIVAALNLDVAAGDIEPNAPLYGEGLGLDSIDILEIALVVSKQYGIQLRADSEQNEQIFRSLRHLADYITAHRTK
jgi:acyl carrier protein